jgi:hypothetical protein
VCLISCSLSLITYVTDAISNINPAYKSIGGPCPQSCGSGSAWIRIIVGSWIRIRVKVESWIRIKVKSRIQIRIRNKLKREKPWRGYFGALEGHFGDFGGSKSEKK